MFHNGKPSCDGMHKTTKGIYNDSVRVLINYLTTKFVCIVFLKKVIILFTFVSIVQPSHKHKCIKKLLYFHKVLHLTINGIWIYFVCWHFELENIWYFILQFQLFTEPCVKGYNIKCPGPFQRIFRSEGLCNSNGLSYTCLYNTFHLQYSEICIEKEYQSRKGMMLITILKPVHIQFYTQNRYLFRTVHVNENLICLYIS